MSDYSEGEEISDSGDEGRVEIERGVPTDLIYDLSVNLQRECRDRAIPIFNSANTTRICFDFFQQKIVLE